MAVTSIIVLISFLKSADVDDTAVLCVTIELEGVVLVVVGEVVVVLTVVDVVVGASVVGSSDKVKKDLYKAIQEQCPFLIFFES